MRDVNYPEQYLLNRHKAEFCVTSCCLPLWWEREGPGPWDSAKPTPAAFPATLLLSQLPTSLSQVLEQALWLHKHSLSPLLASSLTGTEPVVQQGFSVNTLLGCWKPLSTRRLGCQSCLCFSLFPLSPCSLSK